MKKILCFVLIFTLLSCNAYAFAESDLETQLAGVTGGLALPDSELIEKEFLDRSFETESTDNVQITNDSVVIETENGLTISYTLPNENVIFLTQDILQQSILYLYCYQDAMEAVSGFIADGMHLNIFDFETQTDIYLYTEETSLSYVVQNASALSEADALLVQQVVSQMCGGASVTPGTIGNNLWFFVDLESRGILVTYVNGVQIVVSFSYVDDSPVAALTLLDNLSISAV